MLLVTSIFPFNSRSIPVFYLVCNTAATHSTGSMLANLVFSVQFDKLKSKLLEARNNLILSWLISGCPLPIYVRCFSHGLNIVLQSSLKSSQAVIVFGIY